MAEEQSANAGGERLDRWIDRVATALKDRRNPDGAVRKLWKRVQRWFLILNIVYAVILCIVLYSLEYHGETGVLLSLLLFLPAWGWTIPSFFLLPLCLVVNWRAAPIHVVLTVLVLWGFMGYEQHSPSGKPGGITVMSYNYGQRQGTSIQPFVALAKPDLVVFQECGHRTQKYKAIYPDMYFAEQGEFLLMSKYIILKSEPTVIDPRNKQPVVARFVIQTEQNRFAVYAVHMPTPRKEFARLRSKRFFGMLPSRRMLATSERNQYRDFLANKIALAEELVRALKDEDTPYILAGDFNTPPYGKIYHVVTGAATDAFDVRGKGYGFTFPGNADGLYSFGHPWLRIDYIFCGPDWQVEEFHTEQKRKSQHRAIAARLTLVKK